MRKKYAPVIRQLPHMVHGTDYNPDQWLDHPEIIEEDMRLMKLAGINSVSLAIFAWKALEPAEGVYTFEWLDRMMDKLHENGITVILATPSGARPAWMDLAHPEVLRVNNRLERNLHGGRHNHCYTSPYYREKTAKMNRMLAERYKDHPALGMWHISNEYNGECYCENCQNAFRQWLREKYHNDIQELNQQWWTAFWSHGYSDFDEIQAPSVRGEHMVHGMNLDWKRFVTHQTKTFMENEIRPLKEVTPDIPVTTNMMETFVGYNPWELAKSVDVISWDNYPAWHENTRTDWEVAADAAFNHDIFRSLKGKPWFMMESTPSLVNWHRVNKLKRPGVHLLSSVQAIAHGSDSVQYFQWRKSRGASEKFHGAVIDHVGHEHTRVFGEVKQVGDALKQMDEIVGASVTAQAAVIFDWENRWAIGDLQGLSDKRDYEGTCKLHYRSLWRQGIAADVISQDCDFSQYRLIAAPMLYLLKPGVAARLKAFVENGGTLVTSYATGYVNENDLCFLGGFPGDGMMEVTGVWAEEIDSLFEGQTNSASMDLGKGEKTYEIHDFCERIHPAEDCQVLAVYDSDFYQGEAALTKHPLGKGRCYHMAARFETAMLFDFYETISREAGVYPVMDTVLPEGVSVTARESESAVYYFLMNFTAQEQRVDFPQGKQLTDLGGTPCGCGELSPYGVLIVKERL